MPKLGPLMESEINEIPKVFERLLANAEQFEELAKKLGNYDFKSIQILARGTSDNAAHFLKYLIETKIGLPVGLTSPSAVTIYQANLKFENTLVIAISQSGQSTDLLKFAKASQEGGAYLIAITNNQDSPLATIADSHLALFAGKELAVAATKSYAAQLFASLLFVNSWIGKGITMQSRERLVKAAQSLIENQTLVAEAVSKTDRKNEIVFLGRGFSYPNAKEFALKVQETSKISVQGLSIADYMHGPISALSEKTQLFLLAQNDSDLSYLTKYLIDIRARNPKIIWFGESSLALPDELTVTGAATGDEVINSVVDCIIGQRFALDFARKNELDPDQPAGLSKVTVTN
jgi:glucosamine--fructose-6-phosphate aminotransferase (isomerizing)